MQSSITIVILSISLSMIDNINNMIDLVSVYRSLLVYSIIIPLYYMIGNLGMSAARRYDAGHTPWFSSTRREWPCAKCPSEYWIIICV